MLGTHFENRALLPSYYVPIKGYKRTQFSINFFGDAYAIFVVKK